jgi:hypothetical protein
MSSGIDHDLRAELHKFVTEIRSSRLKRQQLVRSIIDRDRQLRAAQDSRPVQE